MAAGKSAPLLRGAALVALLAGAILVALQGTPRSAASGVLGALTAAARPSRIVSLDLCTDQLLIALADAAQIAAVTQLARDPALSTVADEAQHLRTTRGGAEEVLGYDPDLVLAGPYGVASTVRLLERLDRNVRIVPLAQDLGGVRGAVHAVASAVGAEGRGTTAVAAFDARLGRIRVAEPRPTAAVYEIGGGIAGPGSLADAALDAAGYRNMASAYRLTRNGGVPLEALFADPPDLLVMASEGAGYRTPVADNLRHPALRALRAQRPVLELPSRLWLCGTPHIADAIERLAAVRPMVADAVRDRTTGKARGP